MIDLVNDMEIREQTESVERDRQSKSCVRFDLILYRGAHNERAWRALGLSPTTFSTLDCAHETSKSQYSPGANSKHGPDPGEDGEGGQEQPLEDHGVVDVRRRGRAGDGDAIA